MKTSNIILLSVVGSITLIILTGTMDIRFSTHTEQAEEVAFKQEKIELSHFQHLVINNVRQRIILTSGGPGEGKIELNVKKEDEIPSVHYHLNGDTLIIDDFESSVESEIFSLKLFVPNDLKEIKCVNSSMNIENYDANDLSLVLDKTRISMDNQNSLRKLQIKGVNGSNIFSNASSLDTLDLNLDQSQATVRASVTKLLGSMQHDSELSVKEVQDFEFKKDTSSKLHLWN